jgi:hypothetical protein
MSDRDRLERLIGIAGMLNGPVKQRALGANAFHRGRSITDNPHPADTSEHQNWGFGFRAARAIADQCHCRRG